MKDIRNYNSKGEIHRYIETYWMDGKLSVRVNEKNFQFDGYSEWYYRNGKIKELTFYVL